MDPRLPPLSTQLRSLLANERVPRPAEAELRQRLLERARAAVEERPSGIGLRAAKWSRSTRAPRTALLIAAAIAIAGLAVAGANIYVSRTASPSFVPSMPRAATPVVAPQEQAPRPPASARSPASAETQPLDAPRAAVAAPEPTHAPSASTFALELALLEPARSSIAHADFAGALAAIARHQREYPRGQLTEEREALRVRALWGMGDKTAAESVAALFRKHYPHSGLLSWMKATATSQ